MHARMIKALKFLLVEVLNFVNEKGHSAFTIFGRFADGHEEIRQVDFQVAAVGRTLFGFDVQAERHFAH